MCPSVFLWIFRDKIGRDYRLTLNLILRFNLRLEGYFIWSAILNCTIIYFKTRRVHLKTFRAELRDAWELLVEASRLLDDDLGAHSSLVAVQILLETFAWNTWGRLGTTRRSLQDHSNLLHSPTKYSGACCTDIHGPTMEASRTRTGDYIPRLLWHVDHGARRRTLHGNTGSVLE